MIIPSWTEPLFSNAADTALSGTLQVQGIDRWQVAPAEPVPFSAEAKGSVRFEFAVKVAEQSFNAFYPVRATAEFEWQGQQHQARPVLVVPLSLPNPPSPELPPGLKPPAAATPDSLEAPPAPAFPPQGSSRLLGAIDGYEVRVWPGQRGLLDATFRRKTTTYAQSTKGLQRLLEVYWVLHNFIRIHFTTRQVPAVALGVIERGLSVAEHNTLFLRELDGTISLNQCPPGIVGIFYADRVESAPPSTAPRIQRSPTCRQSTCGPFPRKCA